jgi:hypothetical protein
VLERRSTTRTPVSLRETPGTTTARARAAAVALSPSAVEPSAMLSHFDCGMMSTIRTGRTAAGSSEFAAASSRTLVPKRCAIDESVSPRLTRYRFVLHEPGAWWGPARAEGAVVCGWAAAGPGRTTATTSTATHRLGDIRADSARPERILQVRRAGGPAQRERRERTHRPRSGRWLRPARGLRNTRR